jgi:hypothetical protein
MDNQKIVVVKGSRHEILDIPLLVEGLKSLELEMGLGDRTYEEIILRDTIRKLMQVHNEQEVLLRNAERVQSMMRHLRHLFSGKDVTFEASQTPGDVYIFGFKPEEYPEIRDICTFLLKGKELQIEGHNTAIFIVHC